MKYVKNDQIYKNIYNYKTDVLKMMRYTKVQKKYLKKKYIRKKID